MFDVPGSKAWLGLIRTKQEALEIPGPISAKLDISVNLQTHFEFSITIFFQGGAT